MSLELAPEILLEAFAAVEEMTARKDAAEILNFRPYPTQWRAMQSAAKIVGLLGANQSGKSVTGLRRMAWDCTGIYPEDYQGPKSEREGFYWIVGQSSDLTRDSLQKKLFGPDPANPGKGGIIPAKFIVGKPVVRQNSGGAFDTVRLRHISGGVTTLAFKNYAQGRENLQAATLDGLLVDEEPPQDCWLELLMRVSEAQARGRGQVLLTFTPLQGKTKLVESLLDENPDIEVFFLSAEEASHLGQEHIEKWTRMLKNDPAMLKARLYGLPDISSGLIWTVNWRDLMIPRFELDPKWPRIGGLDYGWTHPTVALEAAIDPQTDTMFVYRARSWSKTPVWQITPELQVFTSKGYQYFGDPSAEQPDKSSGKALLHSYLDELMPGWENCPPEERPIVNAPRTPQVRIEMVQKRADQGRLFFFDDLDPVLFDQIRGYSFDKKGRLPEVDDDYCDGLGYMVQMASRARRAGAFREFWRKEVQPFETCLGGY